jgi:hypothetical protein
VGAVTAGLTLGAGGVFASGALASTTGDAPAAPTAQVLQCMAQHGIPAPPVPPSGSQVATLPAGKAVPSPQQFQAAAQACGVHVTTLGKGPLLSEQTRACLAQHGITLPAPPARPAAGVAKVVTGRAPGGVSPDQFRAAAQACGLPQPTLAVSGPGGSAALGLTTAG